MLAEAPTSAPAGKISGNPHVYDVVIPVRLLVGEVENCAPLQAILDAVETTGNGLEVTTSAVSYTHLTLPTLFRV